MSSRDVTTLPVIPDGGWGWVVVIGAFVQHMITHGVFFSIGIMFTSLQGALNGSKVEIALIVSIEIGSGFLSGPVTGYLISRYGTRIVSVVGSILGATGYILSIYVDNVYMLYVTMGLISGVGLGMIIISAIVVVNEYFDSHRALAAGISMAGTGCGGFIFNPLLSWLTEKYGWKGCLLVLAAIILNCIPAGLVYRPLNRKRRKYPQTNTVVDTQSIFGSTDYSLTLTNGLNGSISHSGEFIGDKYTPMVKSRRGIIELTYEAPDNTSEQFDPLLVQIMKKSQAEKDFCDGKTENELSKLSLKDDRSDSTEDTQTKHTAKRTGLLGQFNLFKDVVFTLTVLAQFLFNFGFYVPFVYLPDKSKLEGIDETSTVWVLSTMGIASIAGRIAFGYLADRPDINRLVLYISGFVISGAVTSLLPLYNQTWLMFSYAIIFGMFTGMVLGLTPVVLIDLLGLEILPAAFGISCLFRGFASLLGSPCAGFLVDLTGGFTVSFVVSGLSMVCGAFVMLLARYLNGRQVSDFDDVT